MPKARKAPTVALAALLLAGGAAAFAPAARCYMCINAVLDINASCRGASEWLDGALSAEDVDAMVKWLKEASKTAALGRSVEKARLFGASRKKAGFERTESQQVAIESLKGLRRAGGVGKKRP